MEVTGKRSYNELEPCCGLNLSSLSRSEQWNYPW